MKFRWALGLALCCVLHRPDTADAHAIGVQATLRGEAVLVEAYFDDDTPVRGARVTVAGPDDARVAEGRTDDSGTWSFAVPPPGEYRVTVDARDGHLKRTRITIPVSGASEPGHFQRVTDDPARDEFTAFPWQQALLGCGIFAAVGLIAWAARRK